MPERHLRSPAHSTLCSLSHLWNGKDKQVICSTEYLVIPHLKFQSPSYKRPIFGLRQTDPHLMLRIERQVHACFNCHGTVPYKRTPQEPQSVTRSDRNLPMLSAKLLPSVEAQCVDVSRGSHGQNRSQACSRISWQSMPWAYSTVGPPGNEAGCTSLRS